MIPIKIDINELSSEFNMTSRDVSALKSEILAGVCNELYRNWQLQAQKNLKTTRNQYIRSLQVFREGEFKGGVILTGQLPNMVESGIGAFDMKIKMLKSPKARVNKDGKLYITIPFRIGIPGSSDENFSSIMSPETYKIAKSLKKKQQVKQSQLTQSEQIPQSREFIKTQSKIFESYTHKSSIFAGIQKGQGQYMGQYNTFRRISESASDPNSWIHKGIQAYNLANKALESMNITVLVDNTLDDFLNQKFG